MLHAVRRAILASLVPLALLPGVAQAWYVDISISGAGRVYETTDANELDEHCPDAIEGFASASTTPTGTLGASCQAGSADGDYAHGWTVRYVAEAASGYRFERWESDGRTSPGPVICDGASTSNYTGAACQFRTYANLQTRARFVDDTNPAMSTLAGPNQTVNGAATFTFGATADPTLRRFECRVGGVHEWQTCSSGHQEDLSTGTYTLQVRAVDWSDNRSTEMTWGWTVDRVAPETTLLPSGPSGLTNSRTAQFDFTSNESGSFTCVLTGPSSTTTDTACGSGKSYTGLGDGAYTFTVAAKDGAGNADQSPASRTFTVDGTPPNTTLAGSGPSGLTTDPNAAFSFSSEANATFTCTLNGEDSPCNSGTKTYNGLPDGAYTFTVAATDQAGNADASPATRTFTVDTAAPETNLSATGPSGSTTSQTAQFAFSSPDGGATFRCSVDGGAPAPCSSPHDLSGLAVGTHTFSVVAVDAAGNQDASPATRTWTVTSRTTNTGSGSGSGSGDTGGSSGGAASSGGGTQTPTTTSTNQPGTGSAGGAGAAEPTITGPARGTARLDRRGRFTIPGLKVTCPAACTVSVRITGTTRRVTPSRTGTLRVGLSKKRLAAIKRAKRLRTTVVITVTPAGGGTPVTKRMALTLRAPK